jgi:hypothetical protein
MNTKIENPTLFFSLISPQGLSGTGFGPSKPDWNAAAWPSMEVAITV